MPQQIMEEEEEGAFWHGLDIETREELELGIPPPNICLTDVGRWVWWGPNPELALKGPPLLPLRVELMEVDGAKQTK